MHLHTFLRTQIRKILQKWQESQGSTVFLFTSRKNVCLRTKTTTASCRRRTGEVLPRAEKFGDLITADHKVLSENCESRNNHRYAIVVQDLATQWIQSYPEKLAKVPGTREESQSHLHCQFLGVWQSTCARGAGTHGNVSNLHTEVFSACQAAPHTPQHTPKHTPHTPNTHTTTTNNTTTTTTQQQHTETDRQRQRKWTEKERETREGNTKDKMKDKTRKKRRQDEKQDKRRSRDPEKIKMKCVVFVVVFFLFFCSKLPDPRIISNFSKLPLPTLKELVFPGNLLFVRL